MSCKQFVYGRGSSLAGGNEAARQPFVFRVSSVGYLRHFIGKVSVKLTQVFYSLTFRVLPTKVTSVVNYLTVL